MTGAGVCVLVDVADTVSNTASAQTMHSFMRAVRWSVIGRKKKKIIAGTRTALIRQYMATLSCFPNRMADDARSFCAAPHKSKARVCVVTIETGYGSPRFAAVSGRRYRPASMRAQQLT
jgi:hypothetical protein